MTKLASIQPNEIVGGVPSRPRSALTQEQVFRLLRCAIKDDEELVDEMIEQVYQDIIGFAALSRYSSHRPIHGETGSLWQLTASSRCFLRIDRSLSMNIPSRIFTREGCDFNLFRMTKAGVYWVPGHVIGPGP
jgi:hypothetical protein